MKKVLLIGGTGTISTPICEKLAEDESIDLYVLNRGHRPLPSGAKQIIGDMNDIELMKEVANTHHFDVVVNFIVFMPEQAKAQIEVFKGLVKQYIFISTVVTYNHETAVCISENHEQGNIYSNYGRNKTLCEKIFLEEKDFPVTIVRPSQTYSNERIPLSIKGKTCYSVIHRILNDQPVIVHGDGKSTWHSTHAKDFALGFIPLVGNEQTIGESYQIINDEVVSWDMIYHYLYELLGKTPNIVHIPTDLLAKSTKYSLNESILGDKQYSCVYNMDKIKQVAPEFKCSIDIKTGLKMYLDYIETHPECKVVDEEFDQWCDFVIEKYLEFMNSMEGKF